MVFDFRLVFLWRIMLRVETKAAYWNSRCTDQIRVKLWPGSGLWYRLGLVSSKVENFGFWVRKWRHYRHETATNRPKSAIYGNNSRCTEQIRLKLWPGSNPCCRLGLVSSKVENFGFWVRKWRHYRHETATNGPKSAIYGNNSRCTERIRLKLWTGSGPWCRLGLVSSKLKIFGFWVRKRRHYRHETATNGPKSDIYGNYSRCTEQIRLKLWPGSGPWCSLGLVSSKVINIGFLVRK